VRAAQFGNLNLEILPGIEGQFIFANSAGDTTVSLHAFDGSTFCETQGTAQFFGPNA